MTQRNQEMKKQKRKNRMVKLISSMFFRYGNVFKTHALGSPTVICMDPDVNKYILLNESKGLIPGYPVSMRNILGKNISAVHGSLHKRIRGSLLTLTGPAAIKDHLLPKTDQFMRSFLHNWAGQTIDIQDKTKQVIHHVHPRF